MAGKTYCKNPDMVNRKIADELILVPVRKQSADLNAIYLLNETAGFIWELIDQRSFEEIARIVNGAYDGGLETIQDDVRFFLEQLVQIGAVQEAIADGRTSSTAFK